MDVREALEYPLPVLSVDTEEMIIESKGDHEEVFKIKNSGGGTLVGRIISPTKSLSFEPSEWEGNRTDITIKFSPDPAEGWRPGDVKSFWALILSNGGEATLPITIRLAKMAIPTKEGVTIANLQDFYDYSINFPTEAQNLFIDSQFHMLLLATSFPYVDAYVLLAKEPNRPRAMDNFFILADLKKGTTLIAPSSEIEHRTLSNALIHGNLEVKKSAPGYVEAQIAKKSGAPWLSLPRETLEFDEDNTAQIEYKIDPLLIEGRYAREQIIIKTGTEDVPISVVFKRPLPLLAWLPREGFSYNDEGVILVKNQLDLPLQIDINCTETFVRFFRQEYKVEGHDGQIEIPFIIKLSPLQSAQMLFRKVPSLTAKIEIRSTYKGEEISKTLQLTAGEW